MINIGNFKVSKTFQVQIGGTQLRNTALHHFTPIYKARKVGQKTEPSTAH
jgi:hypothetical protein